MLEVTPGEWGGSPDVVTVKLSGARTPQAFKYLLNQLVHLVQASEAAAAL
jgi:hypothetical protein